MEPIHSEGTNELLEAQAHVWSYTFNFINSMSLKCAIQLGIPDAIHIHGRPITISELVATLSIPSSKTSCVRRLMRMLVHAGFFATQKTSNENEEEEEEEAYVLTPSSKLLVKEHARTQSPYVLTMLDPTLVTPWHFWSSWFFRTERTPFQIAHGAGLMELTGQSSELNKSFNEAMASDAQVVMSVAVKECRDVFEGLSSLIDVGGGTGIAAQAIAEAFPQVKCTVLDLPQVVATVARETKVDFVGGDMFQSIPPADAVFLKAILHGFTDEECVKILKLCKKAIPCKEDGGKVILVEMVVNTKHEQHESTETKLFFDMMMMVLVNGKERTEKEWEKLFLDAGFTHYKMTHVLGTRSLIEIYY